MINEQDTIDLFKRIQKDGWVPSGDLCELQYIVIKNELDLKQIPKNNGAYWIATNEPVIHSMHNNLTPAKIKKEDKEFEIVYNGVAIDLRSRVVDHLLRTKCEGMSGISVDLVTRSGSGSHTKKAFSTKRAKLPFIDGKHPGVKEDLYKINLSQEEKNYVAQSNSQEIFFWNGINVSWEKHVNYEWRFYYYPCEHSMSSHIEIKWREVHNNPRLNSYKKGR